MENFSIENYNNLKVEDIKRVTEDYPYFSIPQFYLLDQYKKNDAILFDKQVPLTALFFLNTNWLTWQLNFHSYKKEIKEELIESSEEIKIISAKEGKDLLGEKPAEDVIAFEPLHTVDYFASQGIKLTDVPITTDKLGIQMKSFTDWLKSMKKINAEKLPGGDDQTDKKIQNIAEASNQTSEIITEAMAEVLVKQEKTEQAIEMYRKLSLLNPPKSAYFAAKIKSLNQL